MTRDELLARIGRQLNKSDTLDARTQARLLDHLNATHRQLLSMPGAAGLRRRVIPFTTVAGQAQYAIRDIQELRYIRDLTNDRLLTQRSFSTYRSSNPDPTTSAGTPDAYVMIGFQPVTQQPDSGARLVFAKSDSASDTTQIVRIEGSYSTGAGGGTLTGTTPINFGHWFYIDRIYLSAPPTGVVRIHYDDPVTGPEIARFYYQTSPTYLAFYLDPTPSAAITYDADVEYQIRDFQQATDEPLLPSDYHDLLVTGAVIGELLHTDDDRLVVLQQYWRQRMGELKLKLARLQMDTGPAGRTSRLGPWAPVTGW